MHFGATVTVYCVFELTQILHLFVCTPHPFFRSNARTAKQGYFWKNFSGWSCLWLTTSYTIPLGPGNLSGTLSYRWIDEQETAADNNPRGHLDSIEDLSTTITYSWNEGRYRVTAFGRNLTDERQAGGPFIGGLTQAISWNEPTTFGLEFGLSL